MAHLRLKTGAATTEPLPTDVPAELRHCASDPIYWLDRYGWTYDPRLEEKTIRFRLYPKQKDYLLWLKEREATRTDGLAEKSRDMGITYLSCGHALHGWLFRPGFSCGFGSRKLELVDRLGDLDSIFEKVRFLLYHLPSWMMPEGFERNEHDNHARLINPANGASITGEGGDNIGRGGRKTLYFVDEAAFIEHPGLIERSLSATTDVRIDVSTPNGPGNPFAAKRFSGKVSVFTMHYRDDPRKTTEWLEKKKAGMDAVSWAQEFEIDYSASIEGICIPALWVRAAVDLPLPQSGPLVAGFDVGGEGRNLSVIVPRRGPVVLPPTSWQGMLPIQSAHRAIDAWEKLGFETLYFDTVGIGEGVKSAFRSTDRPVMFDAVPINTGDTPTKTRWADGRTSEEKFVNLRAEGWWTLRERFRRTYEHVNGLAVYSVDELISLPNHPQLIAELSMPLVESTEKGKLKLESKEAMARRGIKSPDFADALVLAYIPVRQKLKFWVQV